MQWRRKNYLINKEFQFRYIGRTMFGIIVMALVIAFTVYYTTWAKIMDEFWNLPQIAAQFAPLFTAVNRDLTVVLIVFIVIAGLLSIFASHTIAGPMYRFEKTLEAIRGGDLTLKIGLRKSDEFTYLAETINEMVHSLRTSLASDRQLIEEMVVITKKLQDVKLAGKTGVSPAVQKDLEKLATLVDQLQKDVQRFKLQG